MIDQVLSHTSDQHPWFEESRSSRDNAEGRLVRLGRPQARRHAAQQLAVDLRRLGLAVGHARGCSTTCTTSSPSSPTSTSTIRRCRTRCSTSMRFWLERGVDGFRLDTINFYFHRPGLRDNPALAPERAQRLDRAGGQPLQLPGAPLRQEPAGEPRRSCERFRALLDEYPATDRGRRGRRQRSAGSRSWPSTPPAATSCTCATPSTSSAPDTLDAGKCRAGAATTSARRRRDGWACWALLQPRRGAPCHAAGATHEPTSEAYLQGSSRALLMSLRGSVCLYQGEELGLTEAELAFEDLQDPYGIRFWPEFKGRDGCRTPMVWEQAAPQWRLLRRPSPGCRCRPSHLRAGRRRAAGRSTARCSTTTGASSRSASSIRRWPRATSSSSTRRRRRARPSCASTATSSCSASST